MKTHTSTVSSKYQVVIPKEIRKKLNIKPGQKVRISEQKDGKIILDSKSIVDQLAGSMTGAWGKDPDRYIREQREEWERHQKRLDNLWR